MQNKQVANASAPGKAFGSDNIAGVSPAILDALVACNADPTTPYGADALTASVEQQFCELFERDVSVFLVPTGTAANSLCLSVMSPPWGSIFCHPSSHINTDECGAPKFFTNGAKLLAIDGLAAKIDVEKLAKASRLKRGDVHATQPHAVSITQATEMGSVYAVDEIQAISKVCKDADMRLHMDGSRFANALVSLACTPAEMTWKAGVGALSFGATKNGVMGAEAIILFDQDLAREMAYRRKRAGHLFSKMRFLSAQMNAYRQNNLWINNARHANQMGQRLAQGLRQISSVELLGESPSNIIFCRLPQAMTAALLKEGYAYLHDRWEPGVARFVTRFSTSIAEVDQLITSMQHIHAQQQGEFA
ncbi:threonine aldolase family protein [Undibacterium sp. Ji42W]|uniref:threonine aldolase family protein n=1 Tax=Undibacterium sp. Ji42W TaxID=3413039 RepID=UPI003BF2B509